MRPLDDVEAGVRHRAAEAGGVGPEAVTQLRRALHQLDRLQPGGGDRRRDAVREQVRPSALAEELDDLAAARDVAAGGSSHRLAERAREHVDAVGDVMKLGRAAPVRPDEADSMRVVDHHEGVVAVGEIADPGQVGDVPVHREDAVGRDHPGVGAGRFLQARGELVEVAVRVTQPRCLAEPDPVDDRGVVERVGDDGVVGAEQRLEEAAVGVEARAEEDRVLGAEEGREALLELLVQRLRAADEPHRRHAESPLLECVPGGLDHGRMVGEAEVVVGAEVEQAAHPLHLDVGRLGRFEHELALVEARLP